MNDRRLVGHRLVVRSTSGIFLVALSIALSGGVASSGCAGTTVTTTPPRARTAREYLPLRRDAAWSYDARDQTAGGVATLVTLRVERQDGDTFVVNQGRSTSLYSYAEGGVLRNGETILADPIREGTTWDGMQGDTYTIRAVGQRRVTPAGTFENVIEVVRRGREQFVERTFYAPGIGVIETTTPVVIDHTIHEFRLLLRGYTLDGAL
ncbi:MAG: hypothetical protein JNK05_24595 [Myxococcales bacterium]|nr:hypothetical protein [Myxococcales bacterium]